MTEIKALITEAVETLLTHGYTEKVKILKLEKYSLPHKLEHELTAREYVKQMDIKEDFITSLFTYDQKSEFKVVDPDLPELETHRNLIKRLEEYEEYEICLALYSIRDDVADSVALGMNWDWNIDTSEWA